MTLEQHAALRTDMAKLQAAMEALTARLDSMLANEPDDPTQRIVPIPEHMLPHLPPLPKGKTEWIGRGEFGGREIEAGQRCVFWWQTAFPDFYPTDLFSDPHFHIEAV